VSNYHVAYSIAGVLACALVFGVVLFAVAVVRALVRDPDLVVPGTDQAEQVKAHPVGPGEFPPDLAWPFYPFRQSRADLERLCSNVVRNNAAVWRRPTKAFFGDAKGWWVLFPVPAAILSFLLVASLACWFCYLVFALVFTVGRAASLVLLGPAAVLLRGAERWRRGRMRVQAACMRCFHVTSWPAYQCPSCGRPHHDVRPGRLGLLIRRCQCGRHLPTMASRAGWRLTPLCQRCGAPLQEGAGAVRDIRIPVFGDISAGKTRFLFASLNSLTLTARRARLDLSFPDKDSRDLAEFGFSVIRSSRETAKTSTNAQVALTFRLGTGHRSELVHLFDAAGEHFRDARRPGALRFLDDGQGLVYILDPFSIEAVRKQLGARMLRLAHAAAGDPELTYDEVASRLRDSGIPASVQRLAVVVSKADLLRSAGLNLPTESEELARWLADAGVHNLVLAARHEFAEVSFFSVASQRVAPDGRDDPGTPLRWLLTAHGVRLPADPADPAGSADGRRPGGPGQDSGPDVPADSGGRHARRSTGHTAEARS
jgi:double-GTPase-like protein